MHHSHAAAIARLPRHWQNCVRRLLDLPPQVNLVYALAARGLRYEDVVAALARRAAAARALEQLTGRPLVMCPVHMPRLVRCPAPRQLPWRDRPIRALHRAKIDRSPYGGRFYVGATPRNLAAAGVPWRVLVRARAQGWMELR